MISQPMRHFYSACGACVHLLAAAMLEAGAMDEAGEWIAGEDWRGGLSVYREKVAVKPNRWRSRLWCMRADYAGTVGDSVGCFAFGRRLSERIVPMPACDPHDLFRKLLRLGRRQHDRNRCN
jgi:hypothetical protein